MHFILIFIHFSWPHSDRQVREFFRGIEARTGLLRVQVMMSDNQGAGVAPVQLFEQLSHGSLLFSGPRVGGLTADVQAALVADAYRVGVVVQAVGADHVFRASWLNFSVTTDHVVVADTEFPVVIPAMPRIYLCRGTRLIRPHRTAMHND